MLPSPSLVETAAALVAAASVAVAGRLAAPAVVVPSLELQQFPCFYSHDQAQPAAPMPAAATWALQDEQTPRHLLPGSGLSLGLWLDQSFLLLQSSWQR